MRPKAVCFPREIVEVKQFRDHLVRRTVPQKRHNNLGNDLTCWNDAVAHFCCNKNAVSPGCLAYAHKSYISNIQSVNLVATIQKDRTLNNID